jgi:predicted PurR-regulated permease PerM
MSEGANSPGSIDLRPIAAATAVVIGMVATAAVAYLLLDILLLLFLGIVVAAALQPWHVMLARWGIPKGLAVLLIYLLLFVGFVLIALVVGPVLIEQISTFAAELPGTYASIRSHLQASATAPFHLIGQRLPSFERLAQTLTDAAPQLFQSAVGVTKGIVELPAYFVTVLAIGFYWTMEVPRFERLLLSLLMVERRPRALNIWHEIEAKLGGFLRGQGLAMLSIAAASALGYALIGLPNVLALAVLAGLLEAVPMIGPALAVVPAILVALPLGVSTVLLVIGLAEILQLIENNLLIPRIMHHAVGVSALIGLLAVLAFGTLYGILGVLIAIPMTAVIQVLLDSMVVNTEPLAQFHDLVNGPWSGLHARVRVLRQQARVRLRARTSRMGIDPATADHVVDAVDQQIEVVAARVETIISAAAAAAGPMAAEDRAALVEQLHDAAMGIEPAVERVGTVVATAADSRETHGPSVELPLAELREATGQLGQAVEQVETVIAATPDSHWSVRDGKPEAIVDNLDHVGQRINEAVQDIETMVVAAHEESTQTQAAEEVRHITEEIEAAIGPMTMATPSGDDARRQSARLPPDC